ncbi:hypothetical protein RchiOBHm_Chr5g0012691 [Rosa chinensis]|uniref:Uncharacterized protein n=1 Tax=Rosa chinensis TaxID=74649 RepID=A0A2P6Q568_ROSCH|nr:hypothetical protein RchiOBHm_Chr5g0012691 [Rosa chinensis]
MDFIFSSSIFVILVLILGFLFRFPSILGCKSHGLCDFGCNLKKFDGFCVRHHDKHSNPKIFSSLN